MKTLLSGTLLAFGVWLVTPANRPVAISCPCGGAATADHVPGLCTITCSNCGGVLCVAGDKDVQEVTDMWHKRQRGFYDEQ